ncbi:MAG: DUF1269 domain-containing protein [Okeania sp. SIO2D1]|nr:DUF1269 domain-containing protein [Okeania sp. SIO2D1]
MATVHDHNFKRAVGVFNTRAETEKALHALKDEGFDMSRVSVIVKDPETGDRIAGADVDEKPVGNKAEEGATAGAVTGGVLGTAAGLLVGLGALTIPLVGPILLAGAEATAIATTLAGTAIGAAAGGLVGGLIGLGIPEERAKVYSDRVAKGHYLVMVSGPLTSIRLAEKILTERGIQEWGVYDAPDLHNKTATTTTTATTNPVNTANTATTVASSDHDPKVVIVDNTDKTTRR